uniref:Germinal-center associated nuclear protein n=1 Tax=Dicentrarchus labrax TaxID=13489 RepID=A0A8C4IA11_DICLA
MNPSNPFGSPQGGAFQAPNNTMKTGLFPSFGQQNPSNQPQPMGFYQPSAFGQPSALNQPPPHGNTIFGQAPAFGQSTQPPSLPTVSQAPAFGQPSLGMSSGFSSNPAPAFGQTSGSNQSSVFGQTPAFGQPSAFGQMVSGSTAAIGQPQPLGFGQSVFGQPSSTTVTTSVFGAGQSVTQSRGFAPSKFSFKPATEALFKPIFSASPEPANPQTTSMSSSPFSSSVSQMTSSSSSTTTTTTGFPLLPGAKSGTLGFSFSQPAAAPSISTQNNPLTSGSSTGPSNNLQFTFSQPAALSSSSTQASATQPTTPSSFSFSAKAPEPQATPLFGGTNFGQPPPYVDTNAKAETNTDEKGSGIESLGDTNVFARLGKGTKRKEDPAAPSTGPETPVTEEEVPAESDSPRHPSKRPLMRSRGPPVGLFGRALNALRRDGPNPARREDTKDTPQEEKEQESGELVRTESSESLGGMSPTDCTTIMCRNVPPAFNKKDIIEKHFGRFGKVGRIICKPPRNQAVVHFNDHASAAKAKKKGKVLRGQELLLLWQRKNGDCLTCVLLCFSSPVKKSSFAKALQFDTEVQKDSSTEAQSSERPVPSSLLHLLGQVAETAEDKYRLLEQRDKILRQGRPKRTDLDLSKVFVGTCPDMCPEKERYMRETRKQLSIFEVIPDSEMVDHAAAIKEYSRSSADQEEPLPYELRPLPVLSMTMDYLVTQIMDLGHDNYRDWYDFVWNRTRGIRKDITQQHLCCPHTVSLIEKCTRFHVHCAHHLCEEHISTFDAKINNENMTKCLQSLKEMYQDLATRNIYCSREAEFRLYNVLLKLNDGDILREVQQFRDEVRNSPEVKFAVQAFTAVNSNNFVRFFKLVKGASYLASCLLHRYFNQVRAKALKTLNLAHTVGPRSTAFPLEDIVRMLMFRNAAEATDFIQQYGLNVNDDLVELSRVAYQEPDLPLSQKKSEVILSKKTVLIGEVVNGGPLPILPHHNPVCSFDSQNKYRGEGPLAEPTAVSVKDHGMAHAFGMPPTVTDETGEPSEPYHSSAHPADAQQLFQPISQPQPVKSASPPPKPQPVYSNEDVMAVLDCVIEEVVESAVREVADAGASYATTALASVQAETLVSEVLGQMLQEMSSAEIKLEQERVTEEKRKVEEARLHEAFLVHFSFSLCTEIIHEVLDESIKETATSEIQRAVNEKADRVAKCTEQVCMSLVEETLNADIALLVEDILEAELQRIHKYIKRWRDVVAVRRQLKRQMRGFPAAPCCVDPRFKLKALAPSAPAQPSMADLARGVVNLGNAGTLALSSTRLLKMRQEVIHQMRVHYYYQLLLDETVWAPLDLPALVTESISNPPDRIFWKAVLLLPSDHESVASLILSDWLEVKLSGGKESEASEEQLDGTLQTLCVTNTLQEKEHHIHKVHVCVKASRGPLTEDGLSKMEDCCELHGTGALITLLPALPIVEPGQEEQDVPLLSALLQLKQLQQASTWHCPLPLVILVPGPQGGTGDIQKLEEALMLHTLVKEGLISEYTFLFIPQTTSDLQGSKQLSQAMRWLLARAPPPFPLSCQTLVQLIEARLSREFSPRVYAHRQERADACLPSEEPAPIIKLYNAILAHIADTVSSQELSRLSWPPSEFCLSDNREFVPHLGWNSVQHLAWLREAILSLQLPQWEQLSVTDSWSELCSSIFRYAAQIPVSRRSQPLLMSRLENLLERVRNWGDVDGNLCPSFCHIPWDDVLVICIDHKLKDWQIPGAPVCEDAVTEDGEILVYFPTESLKDFQPPEEWTQAIKQTHREKQASAAACATPTSLSLRQRLFHSLMEPLEVPTSSLDITHIPTTQELLAHKVLQSLEEEKAESKRYSYTSLHCNKSFGLCPFERELHNKYVCMCAVCRTMEQLQRWLDGDPVEHLSTPLFVPSSTLLSMPTTITHAPAAKTRDAALTQVGSTPSPHSAILGEVASFFKQPVVVL